jgi:hypothetical protein
MSTPTTSDNPISIYYDVITLVSATINKIEPITTPVHSHIKQLQTTISELLNNKNNIHSSSLSVNEKVDIQYSLSLINNCFQEIQKQLKYLSNITNCS